MKILLSGCNGYMGRAVAAIVEEDKDIEIVAGVDIVATQYGSFRVYANPREFTGAADVVVDFSHPNALSDLLAYSVSKKMPLVLCTTGYSTAQAAAIEAAAEKIPVFRSGNMSLGINVLAELVRRACAALGGAFDVEIVEYHHRRKVDAPSGTAMMLADAASSALQYEAEYVYERQSARRPRKDNEIGISSVRGGTIVGEHSVIFAGLNEKIELRHSAASRDVFAVGAVRASRFMAGIEKPGMYDMSDVLSSC